MTDDLRAELDRLAKEGAAEYGERVEDTAPGLIVALRRVLDYCDDLDKVDLYAGPAFCLRTIIRTALEAS